MSIWKQFQVLTRKVPGYSVIVSSYPKMRCIYIYIYCNYTVIYTGWWFQPSEKYGGGADKRPCNGTTSTFVASVSNLNFLEFSHFCIIFMCFNELKTKWCSPMLLSFEHFTSKKMAGFYGNNWTRNFAWHELWLLNLRQSQAQPDIQRLYIHCQLSQLLKHLCAGLLPPDRAAA